MTVGTEEPFPSCLALPNMSLGISSLFWKESALENSFTAMKFLSWRTAFRVGSIRDCSTTRGVGMLAEIVNFPGKRNQMFPNRCVST